MKKKIIIFAVIVMALLSLWGCNLRGKDSGVEAELSIEEELVTSFLYTLAVSYGESPYDVKLHDAKVHLDDNGCYYVAIDAEVEGINEGERTTFGNEIGFLEGEQVTFSNKEASAYKFFTSDNVAVSKGEKLDPKIIIDEYNRRIKEKLHTENME